MTNGSSVTDHEEACEFLGFFSSVFVKDNIMPDFEHDCGTELNKFHDVM